MKVNGAKQLLGSNRSSKYLPLCSEEERNFFGNRLRLILQLSELNRVVIVGKKKYILWKSMGTEFLQHLLILVC